KLCEPHHPNALRPTLNVRKVLDAWHTFGERPLPRPFARSLLTLPHETTLEEWLDAIKAKGIEEFDSLRNILEPKDQPLPRKPGARIPESLTFAQTSRRTFEVNYWKLIATLAEGKYLTKNNADTVIDPTTQRMLPYADRDLESLGNFI